MKILIWTVIAVVIVMWLMRGKKTVSQNRASNESSDTAALNKPEEMVQCAQCGIHLPASEALTSSSGELYCCEEHRLLHASH